MEQKGQAKCLKRISKRWKKEKAEENKPFCLKITTFAAAFPHLMKARTKCNEDEDYFY